MSGSSVDVGYLDRVQKVAKKQTKSETKRTPRLQTFETKV